MSAPLRVALVGAGAMGSLHARALSQHHDTELTVVVDPDERAAGVLAERYGCRPARELDAAVDAVIIAAPTEHHRTWAAQALALRVPTLIEKPLAPSLAEVDAILAEATAGDVPVMCGFIERWNPGVMFAASVITKPLYFQAVRHSPYVARIKGGVAGDLLIHDVDLAIRLFGNAPDAVVGHCGFFHPESRPGAEDVAEVHLTFGGGIATASASRIAQQKVRHIRVYELERTIEIDLLRQDVTILRHVDNEFEETGAYRQQTVIDVPVVPNRREPLMSQLDHFVALARGEADHHAERASLLAPHRVIDRVLNREH